MKLVITDADNIISNENNLYKIISNNGKIHNCIGCFGCWVKTPGQCVINDEYNNMGMLLSQADEVIIISKCVYGSYSPFVKNVIDRSISYVLPNFMIKNGEMHHKSRYDNTIGFTVYFYGENISDSEKETAKSFVKANTVNLAGKVNAIKFFDSIENVKEMFL